MHRAVPLGRGARLDLELLLHGLELRRLVLRSPGLVARNQDDSIEPKLAALQEQIPQIEASIKEAVSTKEQLVADLAKHKEDREAAKKAIADATAQREKEAGGAEAKEGEQPAAKRRPKKKPVGGLAGAAVGGLAGAAKVGGLAGAAAASYDYDIASP